MTIPRPQFTLRALLILLLAVACFFGGIRFERERRRREDEAAKQAAAKRGARTPVAPLNLSNKFTPGRAQTAPNSSPEASPPGRP